jgi:hypothetical protein
MTRKQRLERLLTYVEDARMNVASVATDLLNVLQEGPPVLTADERKRIRKDLSDAEDALGFAKANLDEMERA